MSDPPISAAAPLARKVRVGLMLDSYAAPAWMEVMLRRIVDSSSAEIVVVVRDGSPRPRREPAWKRMYGYRHHLLYLAYRKLDRRLFHVEPDAFAPRDLGAVLAGVPILDVIPRRTRFSDRFADADLAAIRGYDLDVLVRLGFRIVRGGILSAARCGVWSFHHGDPDSFRGGPAGAWEVLLGSPTTGSVLQVLSEELDGGLPLARSQSCTDSVSLCRSLNGHYWKTLSLLPRQLAELQRLGVARFMTQARAARPAVDLYSRRMFTAPRNREMARLLVRLAWHMARRRWRNVVSVNQWRLLARKTGSPHGSLASFREIAPPRGLFWADPNIVEHEGRCYVFCEEYSDRAGKGTIALFGVGEDGEWPARPATVVERPYHLSYPFVFRYQGAYHMLVECATQRRIESYRCVEFPNRWEGPTIVMDGVSAVDATLFEQDGRWWLFANMVENEGGMPWDEVFLFHAPDPFCGRWTPHPQNPVVSDVRSARPAGRLFWQDGKLIRPAQNCAGGYGRGIVFNEVLKLSECEYEERRIGQIQPDWHPAIRATHTFAQGGGWIVCDADRWRSRFF